MMLTPQLTIDAVFVVVLDTVFFFAHRDVAKQMSVACAGDGVCELPFVYF